ncbi:NAD(P)/FAD-dependent oxidoreductase [Planosporangium thailandense]|uniref:NAD(P)/FAD-dependent oxidoreductase n=1 Tax=Planosporangium thailandense TaxID=765197 RepID=A0ABX0Y4J2_9ACTN|nr:NAD(P)/FAD-dependent oxidoreductase [Planosporangium thailandense]NJC72229.1 NAD(P)/FAD-dependent oxidoreductase [Planosporangium thailandense]
MPDQDEIFDVIVIGAGPVGLNAAARAVRGGLTAVVVEERLAGGECEFYACIPSKALLWPMELAAEVDRMPGLALRGPIDAPAVLAHRDETVSHLDDRHNVTWVDNLPATFVRGHGRLAGPLRAEVTTPDGARALRARHAVVVATGSDPAIPDIPGLRDARPWTNREATSTHQVPERLVTIGGGPVACEMAQALHSLGSAATTMLVRRDHLLERAEPFAGEMVAQSFQRSGIDVRFGRSATRVERPAPGGPVTVHTDDGARVDADEILLGTGRRPAVDDLGLDTVGLQAKGPIEVDDSMRAVDVPDGWLYAVGDVNGRNLLTHMGKYQARVCGDVIAARAKGEPDDRPGMRDTADERGAPQVVFTEPQVCMVGRTEARARADGFTVRTVEYDIGAVSGAEVRGVGYTGRAKIIVDEDRRVLLGATFVAPDIDNLLHSATVAVNAEVALDQLWHAVAPFPTVSEVWLRLLEAYGL